MRFSGTFNQRQSKIIRQGGKPKKRVINLSSLIIRLRSKKDGVLLEKEIAFGPKSRTEQVHFTVTSNETNIEMSDMIFPTLMAYGLELLPKAPNPSDEFTWE